MSISVYALVYATAIYPGLNCQNQFSRKTSVLSFSIKKEQFLSFKDKDLNVMRESKGDDVCRTNSCKHSLPSHLLE